MPPRRSTKGDVITKKRVRKSRPAPAVQPGPVRQTERRAVKKFKQTPEYRGAVRAAYKTQPVEVRKARVKKAVATPTVEGKAIRHTHDAEVKRNDVLKVGRALATNVTDTERKKIVRYTESPAYKKIVKDLAEDRKPKKDLGDKAVDVVSKSASLATPGAIVGLIPGVGEKRPVKLEKITANIAATQAQTSRSITEDIAKGRFPRTITSTAKSLPGFAKATVAGTADLATTRPDRLPKKVVKLGASTVADLNERGKEARENPKKFRERKRREGAIPEISDAATFLGPVGAGAGRAATVAARSGKLGEPLKKVATEPRPKLRKTAGGPAVPQDLSANLAKAVVQRQVDKTRTKKARKRVEKATVDENAPFQGLVPGEGEVVKARLRAQKRDQRLSVATDASRGFTKLKVRQGAEIHAGLKRDRKQARKQLKRSDRGKFDRLETLALEGLVNFDDVGKTRELLTRRRAQIVENRAGNPNLTKVPGKSDEVARIDDVLRDLSPEVLQAAKGYHGKQVERQSRILGKDDTLDKHEAEVRRWQPVGRTLGEHKKLEQQIDRIEKLADDGKLGKGEAASLKVAELTRRAETQFVERVKARAKAEGLPEPVYVMHRKRQDPGFADHAAGGARTIAAPKKSEMVLFDEGRADTTPQAYDQGIAKTIKRSVNWNTVNDIFERNTPEWGRGKRVEDLRQEMTDRRLDPREWKIVDMGAIRRDRVNDAEGRGDDLSTAGDKSIHTAVTQNTHDIEGAVAKFKGTGRSFSLVPKAVGDELEGMTRPSGAGIRTVQKIQGTTSKAILSTSPTYVPVQVASNALLAGIGTGGKIATLPGHRLYKKLDPDTKEWVDSLLGVAPSVDMGRTPRFGASLDNRIVAGWRSFVDSDAAQAATESKLNPFTWNRKLDEIQNTAFRRETFAAMLNTKQGRGLSEATNDIVASAGGLVKILEMPPGPAKVKALREAEPQFEQVASKVDDLLGNWTRYTVRERRVGRSAFLFYGFLRFATKLALYTMPVKHPIASGILAKVGQMEQDEIVDLLGREFLKANPKGYTPEEIETAIRRELMQQIGGRLYFVRGGKLGFVDTAKINPLTGPVIEAAGDPTRTGWGLLSPMVQSVVNASIGKRAATNAKLNTQGRVTGFGKSPVVNAEEIARILTRDTTRLSPLLRGVDEAVTGNDRVQGDDSLPFFNDRPLAPRTEGEEKKLAKRQARRSGKPLQRALDTTVTPVKLNDRETVERIKNAADFPELDRVTREREDLERKGKKGSAEWRRLKEREAVLMVRAGIRKPKKARRSSGGYGSSTSAPGYGGSSKAKGY